MRVLKTRQVEKSSSMPGGLRRAYTRRQETHGWWLVLADPRMHHPGSQPVEHHRRVRRVPRFHCQFPQPVRPGEYLDAFAVQLPPRGALVGGSDAAGQLRGNLGRIEEVQVNRPAAGIGEIVE